MEVKEAKASGINIGGNDCRLITGPLRKAKPAVAAVPEQKDKDGKIIRKAVEAKEATPQVQTMYVVAKSEKIMQEVVNRMAIEKVFPKEDFEMIVDAEGVKLAFATPNQAVFRAAFKKCKGLGEHNAAGYKIWLADKRAKEQAAEEARKKKEAEKAAEKEAKEANKEKGDVKGGGKEKSSSKTETVKTPPKKK